MSLENIFCRHVLYICITEVLSTYLGFNECNRLSTVSQESPLLTTVSGWVIMTPTQRRDVSYTKRMMYLTPRASSPNLTVSTNSSLSTLKEQYIWVWVWTYALWRSNMPWQVFFYVLTKKEFSAVLRFVYWIHFATNYLSIRRQILSFSTYLCPFAHIYQSSNMSPMG